MERKQYQGIVENSRTWWTYCCLSIFCEPITAYNIGKKLNFEIPKLRFLLFGFFIYAVNLAIRIIDFDLESKLTTYDPSVARDMKKADSGAGKLLFEPGLIRAVEDEQLLDTDPEGQLIHEINILLFIGSLYMMLKIMWMVQNYFVRRRYDIDNHGPDSNVCHSMILSTCLPCCSLAQMNTRYHGDNHVRYQIV